MLSQTGARTRGLSISWELVRNASSQASLQMYQVGFCISTRAPWGFPTRVRDAGLEVGGPYRQSSWRRGTVDGSRAGKSPHELLGINTFPPPHTAGSWHL